MSVVAAYLVFVPVAALCFARLDSRSALLAVLIGGWWLLPVGNYGPGAHGTGLPWWITGTALPSDMLVTKAWIAPLVAFAGAVVKNPDALRNWRPAAVDVPMIAWCLWPIADGLLGASPPPLVASLYIAGVWGLPWLIGRVWLSTAEGELALMRAIALSGLANLPVAVIEGVRPPMLYGLLYGPHPFRFDGIHRYVGYRPIGFLEHGNLYGLWTALAAFAALWLVRDRKRADGRRWVVLAIVNVAIALAAQSIGALILLGIGLVLLAIWRSHLFVPALSGVAVLIVIIGAVHLTGIVPIRALAKTPAGVRVIGEMRALGRGSFLWRVSQDTKSLGTIAANPIGGTAHWDWWRQYGTRPWGQPLLLIGQYGLGGFLLAWGALVAAAAAAFQRLRQWGDRLAGDAALPLAILVLLSLLDATLNAFFFFPAILAAGAIAHRPLFSPNAPPVASSIPSRDRPATAHKMVDVTQFA